MSAWLPNNAYLASAIVYPSAPNGEAYVTIANGTSGSVEPTWPLTGGSVVDNTITWLTGTTFREQLVAGIMAVLTQFIAANPTMLRKVYGARPGSLAGSELPAAYIGSRDATFTYPNSIRQTHFTVIVGVVDAVPDGPQAVARHDILLDGLVGAFTRAYHAASGTSLLKLDASSQVPLSEGVTQLLEEELTLTGDIAEGRT